MKDTIYVCSKCGRTTAENDASEFATWLIGPRRDKPGVMVIRCTEHATAYAARQIEPQRRSAYAAHLARG